MILNAGWLLRPCRPRLLAVTSSAVWPLAFSSSERRRASQRRCTPADSIWDSASMRVHIGSDHAGFELKNYLITALTEDGHELVDHGPEAYDAEDDYPVYCIPTAEAAVADPGSLGIVLGGSGNGEQIAGNKVAGVRAVLAYNLDTARLGREHNDANVIAIGARMHTEEEALEMVRLFLATPFSGDPRHARRIELLADYEKTRSTASA